MLDLQIDKSCIARAIIGAMLLLTSWADVQLLIVDVLSSIHSLTERVVEFWQAHGLLAAASRSGLAGRLRARAWRGWSRGNSARLHVTHLTQSLSLPSVSRSTNTRSAFAS